MQALQGMVGSTFEVNRRIMDGDGGSDDGAGRV